MARKHLAALAALICVSTPSVAFDLNQPSQGMTFYFSLPLDARTPKEQAPAFGLSFQGKRQYETVNLDSRMFNFTGTGIEAKWIIAGVIAAGATVAVASKDKKTSQSYQQQQQVQQQQAAQNPEDCPAPPTAPKC